MMEAALSSPEHSALGGLVCMISIIVQSDFFSTFLHLFEDFLTKKTVYVRSRHVFDPEGFELSVWF